MTNTDYQELIGDYRDLEPEKPQPNRRRLYQFLFGIQAISVLVILWASLNAAGYFG